MSEKYDESFFEQEFENLNDHTTSAIERIKTGYQAVDGMHENATYWMIAVLCEFGNRLKSSPDLKRWLLEHDFWSNSPRPPKENTVYLLAARFLLGARATKSAAYEKARNYAAVAEYFMGTRMKPKDVVAKLKEQKMKTILIMASSPKEDADKTLRGGPDKRRGINATGRTINRRGPAARPKQSESGNTTKRHDNPPVPENPNSRRTGEDTPGPRRSEVRDGLGDAAGQNGNGGAREAADADEVVILTGEYADDFDDVAEGEQIVATLRREPSEDRQPLFRVESVEFLDDVGEGKAASLRQTDGQRSDRRPVDGVDKRNRCGPRLGSRTVPARRTSHGSGR